MLEAEWGPGAGDDAHAASDGNQRTDGRGGVFASFGAVGAAFLSALCCAGPLLFVTFGVGAGLASTFEPFRPSLTFLAFALLGLGFWTVYGRAPAATGAYWTVHLLGPGISRPPSAATTMRGGRRAAGPRNPSRNITGT